MSGRKWHSHDGPKVNREGRRKLGGEAFGEVKLDHFLTKGLHDPVAEHKQTECDARTAQGISYLNALPLGIQRQEQRTDRVCHVVSTMAETDHHGGDEHQAPVHLSDHVILLRFNILIIFAAWLLLLVSFIDFFTVPHEEEQNDSSDDNADDWAEEEEYQLGGCPWRVLLPDHADNHDTDEHEGAPTDQSQPEQPHLETVSRLVQRPRDNCNEKEGAEENCHNWRDEPASRNHGQPHPVNTGRAYDGQTRTDYGSNDRVRSRDGYPEERGGHDENERADRSPKHHRLDRLLFQIVRFFDYIPDEVTCDMATAEVGTDELTDGAQKYEVAQPEGL